MKQNYSKEDEKAVLGAILKDNTVIKDIQEVVSPDDFYYDNHKKIYTAILELNNSSIPIDTITLSKYLKDTGFLEEVGGAIEIVLLRDSCPTSANVITYAKSIRKYAIERITKNIGYRISKGDKKASDELVSLIGSESLNKKFSQSDAGNAELLVHLYGDRIRYNHSEGKWLIWNGQFWQPDENLNINELAKQSAQYRQKQAITIADTSRKQVEVKFAVKSEDHHKILACINSAKTIEAISTNANDWNKDELSLQCGNGLLILNEKVEFIKGKPEFMISKSTRINYDKDEVCPLWEQSILEIFSNDEELVRYFQRCVGYTLTGQTNEQKFFLLYGTGANGKSVIFEILRELLGDYAINTRFDTFERKHNKQSNEIARLHNYRLVTANESGDTKKLDSELLKEVTGGDRVTGRFLYKESFDFSPQFKLWLASNSLPTVTDLSLGFWRRLQIIPLLEKFIGEKADLHLVDKLKSELSGILNWAINGFEQYAKKGLNPPKKVINAVDEYKSDSDIVSKFVAECVIENKDNVVTAKYLYQCFAKWYDENYSGKPISQIMFGKRMGTIGHKSEKIGGVKKYIGIKVTNE